MRRLAAAVVVCTLVTACGSTVQTTSTGSAANGADGLGGATEASGTGDGSNSGAGDAGTATGGAGTTGAGSTGGSASSSTGGGAASTTGTGGATGPIGPASAIPVTGPGWDAKTVTIGMTTQQDVQKVATSLGINSVDSGDQKGDAEAVIAGINAKGGLFGRKVKGLYFDVSTTGNADNQGQAACSFFTQDNHVIAVYAAALVADTPGFRACMSKAKVPVLAGGGQAFDDRVFAELGGYYDLMPFPSWTRFAPHFADRLVAQKYFDGWNTALGAPASGPTAAPTKVGFLCPDTPIGRRVGALVRRQLTRVGHAPVDETYYSTSNADVSGYVLKFKSDGISHVIMCDLGLFVFAEQAETQHYRPRYGVSTFNTPILFLQGVVPDAQLAGALGSGFDPTLDVDDAHDPGNAALPAAAACRATAAQHGVSYGPQRRFARGVLYDTCDILGLIVAAAGSVNGLDGPSIKRGIGLEGIGLRSGVTFASGLSPTVHAMPAATRDLGWVSSCSCFQYRGPTRPMS
ncbi:MAG: hypothetical protein JWO22_796 [Frankiales bacterium]|nr:hypothetical protein [Frankiales bacterium]